MREVLLLLPPFYEDGWEAFFEGWGRGDFFVGSYVTSEFKKYSFFFLFMKEGLLLFPFL